MEGGKVCTAATIMWQHYTIMSLRNMPRSVEYACNTSAISPIASVPEVYFLRNTEHYRRVCGIAQAGNNAEIADDHTSQDLVEWLVSLVKQAQLEWERGLRCWWHCLLQSIILPCIKAPFEMHFCMRYGWQPSRMPSHCVCGVDFSVEHALSCSCGGLPSIRHNDIRDLTANLLTEVCSNVSIEPSLQPLTGEILNHRSSNIYTEEGARLDVCAQGFWGDRH